MAVDGYLNFDTKISTNGFDSGTAKITEQAKTAASEVTKTVSKTNSKIQDILDDAERSNKSKAASIAAIYRKEGMNVSEAMEKAWSNIERGSAESTNKVSKNTKQISNGLAGLKTMLGSVGKAVAASFSVKALVSFGQKAISVASDLEEVQNVVDVSFGSLSYMMEDFADKAITSFGISELTAKQTGSTYMAMAKGMGIANKAAADMSIALTGLSADMASFYNKDQSVTATALNSIFTGETETLKQFGIIMTEANLEAYALSQGITKSVSEMSQAEKVQLRYNYVMEQTALAQGDFARTSDGWANQTRILSEQWKEFAGTIGRILMNTFIPAVQSLNKAMTWLNSVAQDLYETLAAIFDWNIESDPKGVVDNISNSLGDATDEQKALTEATEEYQNQLMGFDKINKLSDDSSSSESAFDSGQGLIGGSNTILMDIDTSKADKKLTDFQKKLRDFIGSLKLTFNDVFVDWEDLTGEQIAQKIITGIGTIAGAVTGFKLGGLPGAIVGALTGAALTLSFSSISFDHDGELSSEEICTMIIPVVTGLAGGVLGAFTGNYFNKTIKGATIGFSIGAALGLLISELSFDHDGKLSADEIIGMVVTALTGIIGGVIGLSMGGPAGAAIGATIGMALSMLINRVDYEELGNDIGKFFTDLWEKVKTVGNTISTFFSDMWAGVSTKVSDCWNSIVDFFSPAVEWFGELFSEIWETVSDVFVNIAGIAGGCWEIIKLIWGHVSDWINQKVVTPVSGFFSNMWSGISEKAGEAWKGIQEAFGNVSEWFGSVFSKAWQKVKDVFSKGGQVFVGIKDGILSALKSVINGLISGINDVIAIPFNGINSALSKIKNISILGAQPFYDRISLINVPQIPKLATGHVIPANYGEFFAILGDNKRETEVVSPLSTIEKAVENVMSRNGGNETINVVVTLDGKVIYTEVVKRNKQNTKITGVNALA